MEEINFINVPTNLPNRAVSIKDMVALLRQWVLSGAYTSGAHTDPSADLQDSDCAYTMIAHTEEHITEKAGITYNNARHYKKHKAIFEMTCNIALTNTEAYAPVRKLWSMGVAPSFDGRKWRLHKMPEGEVLWKGKIKLAKEKTK